MSVRSVVFPRDVAAKPFGIVRIAREPDLGPRGESADQMTRRIAQVKKSSDSSLLDARYGKRPGLTARPSLLPKPDRMRHIGVLMALAGWTKDYQAAASGRLGNENYGRACKSRLDYSPRPRADERGFTSSDTID